MSTTNPGDFEERYHDKTRNRSGDIRTPYERDRGRVIHSSAFRRLQGKTQVMGAGEGDFHRTRLTHSIECAQIGTGLVQILERQKATFAREFQQWLPSRDLIEAACFAHDLGHPPFGHGGERALQSVMWNSGGFEGNGQTLRIITKLEKSISPKCGIDPTRRLILSVLKYPIPYSLFDCYAHIKSPPKCYFDEEQEIVKWALEKLPEGDREKLSDRNDKGKAIYKTFDCSLMELADDIAYGVHDIEDIVARQLATKDQLITELKNVFSRLRGEVLIDGLPLTADAIADDLFANSFRRKQRIGMLVNLFVTNIDIAQHSGFSHPLLKFGVKLKDSNLDLLLKGLRGMSYELVISRAEIRQLEQRGQHIVTRIFAALNEDPAGLIPKNSWVDGDDTASQKRRVCDFVAGMTDAYAERIYRRLFIPGSGSSRDEL
jgi:dGTPase